MKPGVFSRPQRRRSLACSLLASAALLATPAMPLRANAPVLPAAVAEQLPAASFNGGGLYRYWGFSVYEARLWRIASGELPADLSRTPLALELQYKRDFSGIDIARRSLSEIVHVGIGTADQHRRWLEQMEQLFPDVREGDRLLGMIDREGASVFLFNDRPIGRIADPAFSNAFFSIWLSTRTSAPGLRSQLLNLPATADRR